jgi:hypothetical protein
MPRAEREYGHEGLRRQLDPVRPHFLWGVWRNSSSPIAPGRRTELPHLRQKIFHSRLIASRGYLGTILEIKPSPSHCNKKLPIRSAETLWRRVEHKAEKFRPSIVNVRARPSVSSKQ